MSSSVTSILVENLRTVLSAIALVLCAGFVAARYSSPLRSIPGPFLASVTNFQRLYWTWTKTPFLKHIDLHRKYGKLVRLGPNVVSISDPAAIPTIYGFNYDFQKSDFYKVMLPYLNGQAMIGTISPLPADLHRQLKKPVARIFQMSNIVSFEKFVDSSIELFFRRIDELYVPGKAFDLGEWLELFVYDTMGELTFSKRYGFLEAGQDVDNIIQDVESFFNYVSLIGQVPWVDLRLGYTPWMTRLFKQDTSAQMVFQAKRMAEHQELLEKPHDEALLNDRDLASRLMAEQVKDPTLPPWASMVWIATNIGAGSGPSATILRALIYHLLKNPTTMQKLTAEVRQKKTRSSTTQSPNKNHNHNVNASTTTDLISWKQCQDLPYLEACVKEAERLNPAIGLPLERIVPASGTTICGKFFPGETVVGMNAWVVHRDRDTFGKDADAWRPERWIECSAARRSRMDKAMLTFGAGSRVCYGDAFSHLIIYKVAAGLVGRYEMELLRPEGEWSVEGRWFVGQKGLDVRMVKAG
ncbi:hypothetical protein MMC25_002730 [Agyrium rufum]|nr:hypothetical protein [Agyrium rufum]